MKSKFRILKSLLLLVIFSYASTQDSLKIRYSIIGMEFHNDFDIIKVKVPNWLSTSELMAQLRRIIIWPGEPLPKKKVYIYAFKDTDQIGDISKTGCVYIPGKGFRWDLDEWTPEPINLVIPTDRELLIYNALTDSIIKKGSTLNNREIRQEIARQFNMSLKELDSICVRVKYWWNKKQKKSENSYENP